MLDNIIYGIINDRKNKKGERMSRLTNKEIKDKVVLDMKNDEDLKQYAKDVEGLPQSSFDNLIKAIDKAYNKAKKEKKCIIEKE